MRPNTHTMPRSDRHSRAGWPRTRRSAASRRPGESGRSYEEQMQRAADVQRSLLPDVTVPCGGFHLASAYRPCETLAGDFYDIFRHPDRVMLMVSDVMGHGAEAALLTMIVKAVFHETAPEIAEPEELLAEMNSRLVGLIPEGTFACTAVVRLDAGCGKVRFSNAGLPYPFVLRAAPRGVEELRLGGLPLGIDASAAAQPYGVRPVSLAAGDVLLIASDGIASVESDGGQFYGDDRLRCALARMAGLEGDTVVDSLVADALDFSNGRPFPDDVNLIAVSCESRP